MTKPRDILYFAYGANLNKDGMKNRCPDHRPLCKAMLIDHKLVFRRVADIEPAYGFVVEGALYEITMSDLNNLDWFEGYPRFYTRKKMEVVANDDKPVEAIIYVMREHKSISPPSDYYLHVILEGCRQCGLSDEYQAIIMNAAVDASKKRDDDYQSGVQV